METTDDARNDGTAERDAEAPVTADQRSCDAASQEPGDAPSAPAGSASDDAPKPDGPAAPKPSRPSGSHGKPGVPFDVRVVEEAADQPTGAFRPIDPAKVRLEPLADVQTSEQAAEAERIARKREEAPRRWRFFAAINVSLIVTAFSFVLFQSSQHFALGGTSGLAIVLASIFPAISTSGFVWILNVLIVVIGFIFLPRRTVIWSAYASIALSAYTSLFAAMLPDHSLTGDMWLDLCFAVLLPAVGAAIAFDIGGSTGGLDIIALIVKRHTSLEIGKALTVVNFGVVLLTFGLYGMHVGLYCILGLFGKTIMVDEIIESMHLRKVCTIVCKRPREIERYIIRELKRTATLTYAYGAYSGRRMAQITCVLSRSEARRLLRHVRKVDEGAFITIVNSSEIVGRGFRFMG